MGSEKSSAAEEKWHSLACRYSDNRKLVSDIYHYLSENYSSDGRYYHTLEHVENMLGHIHSFRDQLQLPDALLFSAWFHDVIYDPLKKDNEEKSAESAGKFMEELNAGSKLIEESRRMIILTRHAGTEEVSSDEGFFLDADISILGSERSQYIRYAENIRKEYGMIPDILYREGRKKILTGFLNKDTIFFTEYFRGRFEEKARENLEYEIKEILENPHDH